MKQYLALLLMVIFVLAGCSESKQSERIFAHFLNRHVQRIKPINKKYNEAVWSAYSGKSSFSDLLAESRLSDSLYKKANEPSEYYQGLLNNVYDNSSDFELLMKIKKSGLLTDTLLKRQFVKVFRKYISIQNNWDETEKRKAKLYEQFFDLKKTESAFWDSIKNEKGVNARKDWIDRFSSLTEEFRSMVISMNNDARRMGYENYYQLLMDFNGVEYHVLDEISQIVEQETNDDYRKLLTISQQYICTKFQLKIDEIKPEHYSYTVRQMMLPEEWRKEYTKEECLSIVRDFFALGNYETDAIIANSDLWYKEGKVNQSFFFCPDTDGDDYRIYADMQPNTMGMYALMHELGHAIHYKYVDNEVPYLLKDPHEITTEGVAIYFNDKLYHSLTFRKMMGINEEVNSIYYKAFADPSRIVFLRKLVRNIQFEKNIFENPDQDFNKLWWDLTKEYLFYNVENEDRLPEWISNQHIVNASGIHVFYLFAFAFSAQLEAYFPDDNIAELKNNLMKYGDTMEWDQILKKATGEELNLNYLFNSYKWKNKNDIPITFDVKLQGGFSFLERKYLEEYIDRNLMTFNSNN